ncbi:MAG: GIY-YIG nuclease family protein [Candidatus Izemoplasma sp.]
MKTFYNYVYLNPLKPGQYTYDGLNMSFLYKPFYVGKGTDKRYLSHIREAKSNKTDGNQHKINTINKILSEEYNMEDYIVMFNYTDDEDLAYENEIELISNIGRKNLTNNDNGGRGGKYGMVNVRDKDGNTSSVNVTDPRYLSGELVGVNKGMVNVRDKDGNRIIVNSGDVRLDTGELVGVNKGRITTEEHKKKISDSKKDIAVVKDKNGTKFTVSINDPRYLSGELVGHTKGMVTVKDKNGVSMSVSVDDPRYLSGELVGVNKGIKFSEEARKNMGESRKGSKSSSARKINIYNDKDELTFECHGNFVSICEENGLPTSYLTKCYTKNIKINYKGRYKTTAIKNGNFNFQGWYARFVDI